jgi:hypothetical protein
MYTRLTRALTSLAVVAALLVPLGASSGPGIAQAFSYSKLSPIQKRILSGFADFELNPANASFANSALAPQAAQPVLNVANLCAQGAGPNVRVNQACQNVSDSALAGRAQAQNETSIAQDPMNPSHLVAFYNNYQRGDGDCIGAYSLDGGRTWTDSVLPTSFTRGAAFGGTAREYWQGHGDPSVAWDTRGNAYMACQVFNRGAGVSSNPDESSAIYVYRSTHTNGASWNFPGRPVSEQALLTGSSTALPLIDKPYMTVDANTSSPFRDRVYTTWTLFNADGSAYIWEANSADYGESFSAPVLVSSASALCPTTFGLPTPQGNCNANQFSQPFTGSDGALYVVYANYNNALSGPLDNHNQIFLSKSIDGGATFAAPVKVADFFDLPDCATYQGGADAGRACVPEKGTTTNSIFRAANYPSGGIDPAVSGKVAITFGSYISATSNETNGCVPNGISTSFGTNLYNGVKTAGACSNKILLSISSDGGATFTGTTSDVRTLPAVTSATGQATTDQFWQWAAFTQDGKLAVSYFDRQYGTDETTGFSDVSLSGSSSLTHFGVVRVTSQSLAPPTQFGGVFYGDYTGLSAVTDAHPLWQDTRNPELFLCAGSGTSTKPPMICTRTATNATIANDQNIFTMSVHVPSP